MGMKLIENKSSNNHILVSTIFTPQIAYISDKSNVILASYYSTQLVEFTQRPFRIARLGPLHTVFKRLPPIGLAFIPNISEVNKCATTIGHTTISLDKIHNSFSKRKELTKAHTI